MTKKIKSKKEIGDKFHDKIVRTLNDSGFLIKKSSYSAPGPDIIVEYNQIKLIIQCKFSESKSTYPSIQSLIDEYSKKVEKYNAERAILAISGYNIPEKILKDREMILNNDKVAIWDDKVIEHYNKLNARIGKYASLQIIGDLGISKKFDEGKKISAIEVKQGDFKFYTTVLTPKFLLNNGYVLRRVWQEKAYQRLLNKRRVTKDIPEFLDAEEALLPNSIIIVSKYGLGYLNGTLSLKNRYASLWIIDGQHRLYSFCNINKKEKLNQFPLLCTIFDGEALTKSQEGKLFVDINTNARTVPKALILEIYPKLGIYDRRVEVARNLMETRAFKGSVKTYSDKGGSINFTTLATNQAMDELTYHDGILLKNLYKKYKNKDRFKKMAEEKCFNFLNKFFSLVNRKLRYQWNRPKKYVFKTDRGIRTLMRFLIYFLEDSKGSWDEKKMSKMLKIIKNAQGYITRDELKGQYAGEGGARTLAKEWVLEIKKEFPDFIPEVKEEKAMEKEIKSLHLRKGEDKKAEEFIRSSLKILTNRVYGMLMYVDPSTFKYLKYINPKGAHIHLIIGHMKEEDKCIKKLNELRDSGYDIDIVKVKKSDRLGGGNIFHQRWLADNHYFFRLETDLKSDSLARHSHTKTLYKIDDGESERIEKFNEKWSFLIEHQGVDIKKY